MNMEEEPNNPHDENPVVAFFLNLFRAIKLPFPPKNSKTNNHVDVTDNNKVEQLQPLVAADGSDKKKQNPSDVVTFPRQSFPPLKLEAEAEDADRNTNPVLLWQVYAIGGFFILRWAWTRWNERKGQKKSDDEPPPPAQD